MYCGSRKNNGVCGGGLIMWWGKMVVRVCKDLVDHVVREDDGEGVQRSMGGEAA